MGVFIAPNGMADGMLETLCVESVAGSPAFSCVMAYFDCLAGVQIRPANMAKAQAHAFIASCREPDVHTGIAARYGYWDLGHSAFDALAAFVASL